MAKAQFCWEDPLLLDAQLTQDERLIRDAARDYCQGKLLPRVQEAFRHELRAVAGAQRRDEGPAMALATRKEGSCCKRHRGGHWRLTDVRRGGTVALRYCLSARSSTTPRTGWSA